MAKTKFLEKLAERAQRVDKEELLHVLAEVTREKDALDAALQCLPDGVLLLDLAGRLLYANKTCIRLLGWEGKPISGSRIDSLPLPPGFEDLFQGIALAQGAASHRELDTYAPQKAVFSVDVLPLRSDRGEVFGDAVLLTDITEKRRIEGRMAQSEKLGALSLLAAGLAHEIGNPLNSVGIHLQLMGREISAMRASKASKKLKKLNGTVQEEIKRLDGIVHRFLAAIRPLKPRMAMTDMRALTRDVLRLLKPELAAARVRCEISWRESPEPTLMDGAQIKQALINLIKNAMQAMPRGGTIKIEGSRQDNRLRLSVQDSGTGIAPENVGRIFDPYFTTRSGGSGLGLMMTYRIVKEHGGDIDVKSRPDKGTEFVLFLPLRSSMPKMLTAKTGA